MSAGVFLTAAPRANGASPGLKAIAMVQADVERGGRTSGERRYCLSPLPLDAKLFARAVRVHWGIENRLRWVLDVVFHDDLLRRATDTVSLTKRRKAAA